MQKNTSFIFGFRYTERILAVTVATAQHTDAANALQHSPQTSGKQEESIYYHTAQKRREKRERIKSRKERGAPCGATKKKQKGKEAQIYHQTHIICYL